MINSSIKEKIDINLSNKKIKKTSLIKNTIIGAAIVIFGFGAVLTNNAYQMSKNIDQSQTYYKSMSDYSSFKAKMDAVPYTDAMFEKDLSAFNYLYRNPDMNGRINIQNFSSFIYTKTFLNNDVKAIEKYLSYEKGVTDYAAFVSSSDFYKQQEYLKQQFSKAYDKKYDYNNNSLIMEKMLIKPFVTPSYIDNNIKTYLKEKDITIKAFNATDNNIVPINSSPSEKDNLKKIQESKFLDYVNSASDSQLRDLFKMYNSYFVLIGLKDNASTNKNLLSSDFYIFNSYEVIDVQKEILNKIESIKKDISFDNKDEERDRQTYKY